MRTSHSFECYPSLPNVLFFLQKENVWSSRLLACLSQVVYRYVCCISSKGHGRERCLTQTLVHPSPSPLSYHRYAHHTFFIFIRDPNRSIPLTPLRLFIIWSASWLSQLHISICWRDPAYECCLCIMKVNSAYRNEEKQQRRGQTPTISTRIHIFVSSERDHRHTFIHKFRRLGK